MRVESVHLFGPKYLLQIVTGDMQIYLLSLLLRCVTALAILCLELMAPALHADSQVTG